MGFLDYEGLKYWYSKIKTRFSNVEAALKSKVDAVEGKGLSTNDYTTIEKEKLSRIADGAKVNVQPDWAVTDTLSDAYINNKPTSMPASDVPDWAKAASKPSYSYSEITDKPESFNPALHSQSASTITAGTFTGKVNANAAAMATLTTAQVRDIVVLDSDPGEGATVEYPIGSLVGIK